MPDRRGKPLYARLSDDAHAALHNYADCRSITVTALLEAIGEQLAAGNTELLDGLVRRARQIAADRRRHRD